MYEFVTRGIQAEWHDNYCDRAFSLSSAMIIHSLQILHLEFTTGKKSRMLRPTSIWAGDILISWSGVFRYCISARANLSVSRYPLGPMLSNISHLTVLTATSVT